MTKRGTKEGDEAVSSIDELNLIRNRLRESEDEFRRIINEIPVSMSIITPEGEILLINRKTLGIFDGTYADLIGTNVSAIWENPAQRDEWLSEIRARGIVSDYEFDATTFTGVHKILQMSGLMITFEGRRCILSVHEDVTEKKNTENELRASRERYRSLVENLTETLFIVDTTGVITYLTPNIRSITGYSASEMMGEHYTRFVHPDDRAGRKEGFQALLAGKNRPSEYRILRKDGGIIWVRTNGRPVVRDGEITGAQGILTDITPLKTMEEELREANARLSQNARKLSVLNGIITAANQAEDLQSLFRNVMDSVLSFLDWEAGGIYIADPDTRTASIVYATNIPEKMYDAVRTVPTNRPPYSSLFVDGKPILTSNLGDFSLEIVQSSGFSSLVSVPLISKGRVVGALNAAGRAQHEITGDELEILLSAGAELGSTFERFGAEEGVKRNAENLEVLFNSLAEMVFILDLDGKIVTVNKTVLRRLGYHEDELAGMDVSILHPEERREEVRRIVGEMRAGSRDSCPIPVIAKDGGQIDVETKITHGWWDNREVIIGVARDVSEKRRAEAALRKSEEEYRAIYDNSPIAIGLYDAHGYLTHANPASLALFGVDREEALAGLSLFEDPNISDADKELLAAGHPFKSELIFDFEMVRDQKLYPTSRRGVIWMNMVITPLKTPAGSVSGYLVHVQDINDRKQMAEELRRSEEKYRDLADNAPIGILTCDKKGHITYVNSRVPEMLGSPAIEKTAEINLLQTGNLIQAGFADVLRDVLENRAEYPEFELDYTSVWGRDVYLRLHISPILNGDTPLGARIIIDDISRRREAETLLERTQFAFDHSPDEIYFVNRDGLIVYANARARRSFGLEPDSLVSTTIFDINPDITPKEWARMWEILEFNEFYRFESMHWHSDGTAYPVDVMKYRIRHKGEAYSCTIARDITAMKQSEENLRKSETRLRTLIQTIPDLVWLKDEKGIYLACNSMFEQFFGAKETEIVGKTDYDFVDRGLADFFRENDRRAALAGKPTVNEEWITFAADGRRALLETIKTPLYATEGTVAGVLGIGRDITDRKQSEEAIREANRKLNLLSSITRHDVLNQITGASAYLEMLELDGVIPPGTTAEEYFKKISGAVETIERQIRFTGYYKDLGEQAPDWFDVGRIIEEVGKTHSFSVVRIQNDIKDIEVFADPLFEKVIYNLIDNAVKHGETITEIVFSSIQKQEELIVVCEDDGVGIPADVKEKIFRREHFKNSGLGLFLSREILAITGLTIMETGIPGAGARFEIHVPEGMFRRTKSGGVVDK